MCAPWAGWVHLDPTCGGLNPTMSSDREAMVRCGSAYRLPPHSTGLRESVRSTWAKALLHLERRQRRMWAPLTSLEALLFLFFASSSSSPWGKPQSRSSCMDDGGATRVATFHENIIFGVSMVVVWVLLAAGMLLVVVRSVGVDGGLCCCGASYVFVFDGVPSCRPCCYACSSFSLGSHCVAVSLVFLVLSWFIFALQRCKIPLQLANRFEFS